MNSVEARPYHVKLGEQGMYFVMGQHKVVLWSHTTEEQYAKTLCDQLNDAYAEGSRRWLEQAKVGHCRECEAQKRNPGIKPIPDCPGLVAPERTEPVNDDAERIACNLAGEPGHGQCGICLEHRKPRFECGCFHRNVTPLATGESAKDSDQPLSSGARGADLAAHPEPVARPDDSDWNIIAAVLNESNSPAAKMAQEALIQIRGGWAEMKARTAGEDVVGWLRSMRVNQRTKRITWNDAIDRIIAAWDRTHPKETRTAAKPRCKCGPYDAGCTHRYGAKGPRT